MGTIDLRARASPAHTAGMKLDAWLAAQGLTPPQFALLVGVDRRAVTYWINGERMPTAERRRRIAEVTHGAVTDADLALTRFPRAGR